MLPPASRVCGIAMALGLSPNLEASAGTQVTSSGPGSSHHCPTGLTTRGQASGPNPQPLGTVAPGRPVASDVSLAPLPPLAGTWPGLGQFKAHRVV